MFDTSTYFQSNTTPSYAPTPPPANPAGAGQQALQNAAKAATKDPDAGCGRAMNLARGLDNFSTYTQRAALGVVVVSLVPQAFGGPVNPAADIATAAGASLAGVLEISSLAASSASGALRWYKGDPLGAAITVMSFGLGKASGLKGASGTFASTVNGEMGSALNAGRCK